MGGPDLRAGRFPTTHWSVVCAAGAATEAERHAALEWLCRRYWAPVVGFIQRRGFDHATAEDHAQTFLARAVQRDFFARAESARGRLRSFLLTSLRNFLVDEVRRGRAVPPLVTMDDSVRETAAPADAAFERQWAEALLARVLAELELEFARRGKGALFRRIESRLLATEAPEPYADVAVELGLTEQAVKAEVYRLRQRFRQLVRDEVARTVTTAAEIEEELQVLFRAYRR
ncbi:hypothetical protein LBMAG56_20900 [Verrucomicrobiota bacterium]|nr:hypothetical protein LBMAG56_20900 [Verrucomicrobiota bacterium]